MVCHSFHLADLVMVPSTVQCHSGHHNNQTLPNNGQVLTPENKYKTVKI